MTHPELPNARDYIALGCALRKLRKACGLTQVEAADRIGIRSTFVSQVENGHRGMRWHTLLAFLDAYGADLRMLADAIDAAQRLTPD
jgi:transcriptional regulator with XRE-family HTH domain